MSTRPAPSWPWLDDVLVELADDGVFDDVDDDPILVEDVAEPAAGIAAWLGSAELADLTDPAYVAALDDWTVDGEIDLAPSPPSASDHDPFHFEPTTPDDADEPDLIAEVLLETIDSAPDFVADPTAADPDGTELVSADGWPDPPRGTSPALDATDETGFASKIDGTSFDGTDLATDVLADTNLDDGVDAVDGVDDTSGDLDDFDGVDGVDDFDGL